MDGTNIGPYFPPHSHPWRQQKSPVREQTSKRKEFGMMFYHLCQKIKQVSCQGASVNLKNIVLLVFNHCYFKKSQTVLPGGFIFKHIVDELPLFLLEG